MLSGEQTWQGSCMYHILGPRAVLTLPVVQIEGTLGVYSLQTTQISGTGRVVIYTALVCNVARISGMCCSTRRHNRRITATDYNTGIVLNGQARLIVPIVFVDTLALYFFNNFVNASIYVNKQLLLAGTANITGIYI